MNLDMFSTLASRQMTRKEFLLYVGAVIVAISGITTLLKTLTHTSTKQKTFSGFGFGPYGGRKDST